MGKDGFFDNLIRGRSYITMVAETFGNKDIANRLENMYATTGEYPEGWVKNLDSILDRLAHPSYQNIYVIVPAANDLIKIFEKKKSELEIEDINLKLDKLSNILTKNFQASIKKSRNLSIYQSILNEELTLLRKEINQEIIILKNLLVKHGLKVYEFIKEVNVLLASYDSRLDLNFKAYLKLKMSQTKILESMRGIKGFSDEPKYATKLVSFFMKNDMKLRDMDKSADSIIEESIMESDNIDADILIFLKRTKEIKIAVYYVDNHISYLRNNYLTKNIGMKECTILDEEYLA